MATPSPSSTAVGATRGRWHGVRARGRRSPSGPAQRAGRRPGAPHALRQPAHDDPGSVAVVDIAACHARRHDRDAARPLTTVTVGDGTYGMPLDAATHTLYIANLDDNTISRHRHRHLQRQHPAGCPATRTDVRRARRTRRPRRQRPNAHGVRRHADRPQRLRHPHVQRRHPVGLRRPGRSSRTATSCFGAFSLRVDESTNTIYEPDGSNAIAAVDGRACNAGDLAGCASAPIGKVGCPGRSSRTSCTSSSTRRSTASTCSNQKDDTVVMVDSRVCNGRTPTACEGLEPEFVHTGTDPVGIDLDAGTHTLYVADQLDDDVVRHRRRPCSARDRSGCRVLPPRIEVPYANGVAVSRARAHRVRHRATTTSPWSTSAPATWGG